MEQPKAQSVIILGKPKSMGIALILAFLFGPLGLLYASVAGGIILMVLGALITVVVTFLTFGIGTIVAVCVIWLAALIWAAIAVSLHNRKLADSVKAAI